MERFLIRLFPLLLAAWVAHSSGALPARTQSEAGTPPAARTADHRVIVHFADSGTGASEGEPLVSKVQELAAKPGVVQVQGLVHLGMALATCESLDAQERLVRELEEHPLVELATPDTRVYFDAINGGTSNTNGDEEARKRVRGSKAAGGNGGGKNIWLGIKQCAAQPNCAALVAFRSFFGKYVAADENGAAHVDRDWAGSWEEFVLISNADQTVSLRSYFGKYVSAESTGAVSVNRDSIRSWEKFTLIENADSTVSLKSSHGKYLVADENGRLHANRDRLGDWERFQMISVTEPVAFQSFFGKYMVAERNGSVNANRHELGGWEIFGLRANADHTVSLISYFGKYVSADAAGAVSAKRESRGDGERFELIRNADSTVSLKSSHGKYFAAEADGRLYADRDRLGDWEKFRMVSITEPDRRSPNDGNFSALWGMSNAEDTDIDAPEAWKIFTGEPGAGIVVAVIDTGIDYTHEDLAANMWVNPNEIPGNGIDDDCNGIVDDVHGADFVNDHGDPMDDNYHGTHCAGTIAGVGNNGVGVTGVAWHGVRLMALKFLDHTGHGKTSDAVRALDYAVAHGVRIASNSWESDGSSAALRMAIARAEAAGVLFVAAAGNWATDNDEVPRYPASYAAGNIVSVASTAADGQLSPFSCYGAASVDVAAPGSYIYSTVPGSRYGYLSGTSMATPHVSGLAALLWMYRPSISMAQVKEVLLGSVLKSESLEGKVATGGRINARNALLAAKALEPSSRPHGITLTPQALKWEGVSQQRFQARVQGSMGHSAKAPQLANGLEPWLPHLEAKERREAVWPEQPEEFMQASGDTHRRILGTITVPGMDARLAKVPAVREVFRKALVAALHYVSEEDVRIVRAFAAVSVEASTQGVPQTTVAGATMLEFEVRPAHHAPQRMLDLIEARLILLGAGGRSWESFNRAVVAHLGSVGAALPAGTQVLVMEPRFIEPKGSSRKLLAAAAPVVLQDSALELAHREEGAAAGPLRGAAPLVGLAAAVVLAAAALLAHRRGKPAGAPAVDEAPTDSQDIEVAP